MTEVRLTSRRDSEFYAQLPKSEYVDLCEVHSNVHPDQVCRTCKHQTNRAWNTPRVEQIVHINSGGKLEDIFCKPDKPWGGFKVLNQTDWRNRIVPMDYAGSNVPTRATVETCGQQVITECARCDRFVATVVKVAYTDSANGKIAFRTVERNGTYSTVPYTTDGSPVKYWNVSVGGHCSIPAEGIRVGDTIKRCDPQPRLKRVENPSCANCFYLDNKGDQWQFHHLEVNENAWLTPYEREKAGPDQFWLELWRKQTDPKGRRYWFTGQLLAKAMGKKGMRYKIRFDKSNAVGIIAEGDDRYIVHFLDGDRVAVDILYPYNKPLRLVMPTRKRVRVWPSLPTKTRVVDNKPQLANPNCHECRPNKACYYHAKGPETNILTGEFTWNSPEGKTSQWVYPPNGLMKVTRRQGKVVAVDGNDQMPMAYSDDVANATVFRMWLPTLLEQAHNKYGKKGREAIYKQYLGVMGGLSFATQAASYRPAWLRNTSLEPNKAYCSHPEGPNLRKVFQDSFGSERVDWDFDHGAMTHDAVEEEWRVGYRQHSQTPQKLQEEILATDTSHPRYDPGGNYVPSLNVPSVTNVTIRTEAAIGGMYRPDGSPVTSVAEFCERLDEEVTIGMSGQVERKMTRREQLFGYKMSRGYFGRRRGSEKTSMPAADPTHVIFSLDEDDPDQMDITDAWICPDCGNTYDSGDVDFFDPLCECGSDLFKNHTSRETYNPRAGGGVGNAYVMESPRTQDQKRLFSTLCPRWRLNAKAIITLDDIHGAASSTPAAAQKAVKETLVRKLKVKGSLNEEQKAINAEYDQRLAEVIAARAAHKETYPDTTAEELFKLYPTPRGTVYEEQVAGSVAKMGSS